MRDLWKPLLAIGACCFGMVGLLSGRAVEHPPGVLVEDEPLQTPSDAAPFTIGVFELTPRARFDIAARVLSVERYKVGTDAELSPVDFAVGWGAMSDSAVLDHFRVTQSARFFTLYPDAQAIDLREALHGATNMHLIPANDRIRDQLEAVRPGHVVHLQGLLVNISGPDGYTWNTSLTRSDTGAGACELFYVQGVEKR
jgi:hypothetical protein